VKGLVIFFCVAQAFDVRFLSYRISLLSSCFYELRSDINCRNISFSIKIIKDKYVEKKKGGIVRIKC